jgi:hypothetical protein
MDSHSNLRYESVGPIGMFMATAKEGLFADSEQMRDSIKHDPLATPPHISNGGTD